MVRQMFEMGILQSGFWHQFAMTAHSPVGLNPEEFGVVPNLKKITFANNDVEFTDKTGIDHSQFSFGLKKSLFNYMHGICFENPLQDWFEFKIPKTTIHPDYIHDCLAEDETFSTKPNAKIIWTGNKPLVKFYTKSKKGNIWEMAELTFHEKTNAFSINLEKEKAEWLLETIEEISLQSDKAFTFNQLKAKYELTLEDFELFWYSKPLQTLKENGIILSL
jgi:hypothetical protein